jgi:hypothetical protein
MERVKWTDDLIDERMTAIDEKFDRQLEETRALREEVRSGFSDVRAGFSELRGEMQALQHRVDARFSEQYRELIAFHRQVLFIVAGFVVALIGLLSAVVAQA